MTLASKITALGALVGLAGLLAWDWFRPAAILLLWASVGLDCLDGWVARQQQCSTPEGAQWDWTVDTGLSHLLVWLVVKPPFSILISCGLLLLQAVAIHTKKRVSGRAFVTAGVSMLAFVEWKFRQ